MKVGYLDSIIQRIPIRKPCKGYYLRWYYNGWHYWFFLPGEMNMETVGEAYRTIGTRKISIGSGQLTYSQAQAIRTILLTREIYLLTSDGWKNIRIEPSSVITLENMVNGYEMEFVMIIGSKEISYETGYTPVPIIPVVDPIPDPGACERIIGSQVWACYNYASLYPGSKVYNDNEANRALYGGLYSYNQIRASGFTPEGCHVPTIAEFETLMDFLGGTLVGGGELKEVGMTRWAAPNAGAVDTYGFTMPGSGYYRNVSNSYHQLLTRAYLWAITGEGEDGNIVRFTNLSAVMDIIPYAVDDYFSVRLIKDIPANYVTDIDGNIYHIITIGTQEWIVENLKTTRYADGTPIPNLTLAADWIAEDGTPGHDGAYCWYNNDIGYKNPYGAIYNWHTVNNAAGLVYLERGGIEEVDWRVPLNVDWNTLFAFLGGSIISGGKLKEEGLMHWAAPNTGATNESGFTMVGSGIRNNIGAYFGFTTLGFCWCSDEFDATNAYYVSVGASGNASSIPPLSAKKIGGWAIRLVRDV